MYILVKASLPSHKCVVAAHGSLMAYLRFQQQPETQEWLQNSFRKVVCEVTDDEFEEAKSFDDRVIVTESAFGGMEVGLAFMPRKKWPEKFKTYRLIPH